VKVFYTEKNFQIGNEQTPENSDYISIRIPIISTKILVDLIRKFNRKILVEIIGILIDIIKIF